MIFLLLFSFFSLVIAEPATLGWNDCFVGTNTSVKLSVNTVYGQVVPTDDGSYLNLTVLGSTPETIFKSVNTSSKLCKYSEPMYETSLRCSSYTFHNNLNSDSQCLEQLFFSL